MSERELYIALAQALGWSVYHYDKDVESRCYYMLMDHEFDPVVIFDGERKTEEEAWDDAAFLLRFEGMDTVLNRMIELGELPSLEYKSGVDLDDVNGLYWEVRFRRTDAYDHDKKLPCAVAAAALDAFRISSAYLNNDAMNAYASHTSKRLIGTECDCCDTVINYIKYIPQFDRYEACCPRCGSVLATDPRYISKQKGGDTP